MTEPAPSRVVYRRMHLLRRVALAALPVLLAAAPATAAKAPPAGDAAPQLVSTGPRWNVTELQRVAAEGDPQACFELGDRLLNGDELAADPVAARKWLKKAAQGGVGDALFRLGKLHHDGIGGPRDFARALDYYAQAARAGIPEAQHNIGAMLVSGRGVKRDYVEGLAWLIVATKHGAVSDAEQRTRERLAKRPADIAAAEARAQELIAALQDPARRGEAMPRFGTAGSPSGLRGPRVAEPKREPPPQVKVDLGPGLSAPKPEVDLPKT